MGFCSLNNFSLCSSRLLISVARGCTSNGYGSWRFFSSPFLIFKRAVLILLSGNKPKFTCKKLQTSDLPKAIRIVDKVLSNFLIFSWYSCVSPDTVNVTGFLYPGKDICLCMICNFFFSPLLDYHLIALGIQIVIFHL